MARRKSKRTLRMVWLAVLDALESMRGLRKTFYPAQDESHSYALYWFEQWFIELPKRLYCAVFDHALQSEADIGPDHGSEDFWCTRCSWSPETVVYY
jgi:hypothetical protein